MFALSALVDASPETKRSVVVALFAKSEVTVVEARVDDAFERKPPMNSIMVVVACSPPACLVNGKEKVMEAR